MFQRLLWLSALLICAAACGDSYEGDSSAPSPTATESPSPRPSATVLPTFPPEPTLPPARSARPGSFVFAAAGDHGANENTEASLGALDKSGAAFYLSLGDNDYDQTPTDAAWCDFVRSRLPTLGGDFPLQLVGGNHEDDGPNGNILDHAACLPDRLNSTGRYAAQYYFDYPAALPLMRAIMISPNLIVGGVRYEYAPGTDSYAWLSEAIDSARSAGIPWVVVGMHKNCITTGAKPCEIGEELLNLLVEEKVDLVLQGHDHNYQRSKQVALGQGCRVLEADAFNAACVAGNGSDGQYAKGSGTVIVISGAFGQPLYPVKPGDPEADYFAVIDATSNGFIRFSVTGDRIQAEFVPSTGDFSDAFTIARD